VSKQRKRKRETPAPVLAKQPAPGPEASSKTLVLSLSGMVAVAAVVVLAVLVNILSARHYHRWDLTDDGLYTISRVTEDTLKTLPEPVEIKVLLAQSDPLTLTLRHLLEAYKAITPKLSVDFIDPDRHPAEFIAIQQKYGIAAGKSEDGKIITDASVIVVRGDRRHFITPEEFQEVEEGEEAKARSKVEMVLTAGLKLVTSGTPPKVCFTSGFGEPLIDDGGMEGLDALHDRLDKLNYQVVQLLPLRELETTDDIDTCKLVVVAGPDQRMDEADVTRLKRYFENGGNALVFVGPELDAGGDGFVDQGLAPLLAAGGIRKRNDLVFERDAGHVWSIGQGEALLAEPKSHPITDPFIQLGGAESIVLTLLSSLEAIPDASVAPTAILMTSDEAFGMRDFVAWAENPVTPEPEAHDRPGPLALAYAVELPNRSRMVVLGTKSAMVAANWKNPRLQGTGLLVESIISWLASQAIVLDIPQKPARELGANITEEMLTSSLWKLVVMLPLSTALAGLVIALVRRRGGGRTRLRELEASEVAPPAFSFKDLLGAVRPRHHASTIAVLALAVLSTFLVLLDRGRVSTGEAELRAENLLDAWRVDDLTQIDVKTADHELTLARERTEDDQPNWVLYDHGEKLDGDEQAMSEYAMNLELALFERRAPGASPAESGLDAPRATITVHMGSVRYVVKVGGPAPSPEGAAYVEVQGGARDRDVYVIKRDIVDELLVEPAELRTRRLAMLLSPSVEEYRVSYASTAFTLKRGGWGGRTAGAFLLEHKEQKTRAAYREVDAFLTAVGRVEVTDFAPVPEKDPEDAVTVTIKPRKGGSEIKLVVGGACEGGILAVRRAPDPVAGCIPKGVGEQLRVQPETLVDRRVLGTAETDLIELKLDGGGKDVVEVARQGGGWHMRRPTDGVADDDAMKNLLAAMIAAEGTIVRDADLDALGLRAPRGRVRIIALPERGSATATDVREENLEIGAAMEDGTYVLRKDDGLVLKVDSEVAESFLPHPSLLRGNSVIEEDTKYIAAIETDCEGKRQRVERGSDGNWTFATIDGEEVEDAEVGVDGALVTDLVDGLRQLKAVRWVAEVPAASHGLDPATCRVTLELDEPDPTDPSGQKRKKREREVIVGSDTQGGNYAKLADGDAVFVAPRALKNAASLWLLSRTSLLLDDADVDTLTLKAADGRTLTVTRQGKKWKAGGEGGDALGEQVHGAIDQLVAELVMSRGKGEVGEPILTVEVKLRSTPDKPIRIVVGDAEVWRHTRIYRVRRSDRDVVYGVAQPRIQPLLDAL
jgi:hypothetical protein